jgi:hypothetical protein
MFPLILILSFFITFVPFIQPVYADDEDDYYCRLCDDTHDLSELSFSQKIAIEWNDVLYSGDWFGEKEQNASATFTTEDVLEFDITTNFNTLWTTGETLYTSLMPIGLILCTTYALMELLEEVTNDNVSPEKIVRCLGKICLGVLFVQNGFEFCSFVMAIASSTFSAISSGTASMPTETCLYTNPNFLSNSFTNGMSAMAGLYIPWLIVLLAKVIISIICWTRIVDIMIKIILAPIGMSDIMVTGTRGSGWAFFKKLLTSALQGAVIVGITFCYGEVLRMINAGSTAPGLPRYALTIVCTIVTVAAIIKSQSYAQEIVN